MHPTMSRLYLAAKQLHGIDGQSAVANRLNESPQTLNNWEARGMSRRGMTKAELLIGCRALWLETGESPLTGAAKADTTKNYPRVVGTAQMGNKGYYLDLDGGDGYVEFESEPGSVAIRVRGDSMHPAIRDGWFVIMEPSGKPTIGEYVLIAFSDGKKMVKELLIEKPDCYVVMSVNNGERITAMKSDIQHINAISAVIPPSKHKEW